MTVPHTSGTITLVKGSAVVNGTDTAWQAALIVGGVIFVNVPNSGGLALPILTVDSNTKITAAMPWQGANGTYSYTLIRDGAYERQSTENAVKLGALLSQMQDSIKRVEEQSRRSEDKSDQSRAAVHHRMDEMVNRVSGIEQTMAVVKEDVSEMKPTVAALDDTVSIMETDVKAMKPVTDEVKRWKLMGIGALGMIGIGGIALGVSFADALKRVLGLLIGKI